ncbi:hypothetical protein FRC01_001956 [Tulasnella sp. 417]|nr:hypothetical protein FRC01_001956 [Tulasnella sp. 417]
MASQQHTDSDASPQLRTFERLMGDTELSYYLPSRADGINDMLSYTAPASPAEVLQKAETLLKFQKNVSRDELFDRFLNGKRVLGENRLSYLIVTESLSDAERECAEYSLLICSTHFSADGVSFQQLGNEFCTIVAGTEMGSMCTDADLEEVGGHALPRTMGMKRKEIVQTITFDEFTSRTILQRCKSQGVSFSDALFALCALAWSRIQLQRGVELRTDLPIMMYSAINLRPHLLPSDSSYWMTALGFFNIILPSFLPHTSRAGEKTAWKAIRSTFWHRARSAKAQSTRVAKHPLLPSRAREMARQRSETAKAFAAEDDAKELRLAVSPRLPAASSTILEKSTAPSTALLGLSNLGNLDGIYIHKDYPSIQLHTLTSASRVRPGGLLLFGYTFAGRLTLNLAYDLNGFKDGIIEAWWKDLLGGCDELLAGEPAARL